MVITPSATITITSNLRYFESLRGFPQFGNLALYILAFEYIRLGIISLLKEVTYKHLWLKLIDHLMVCCIHLINYRL